jgi:hypothetical protein
MTAQMAIDRQRQVPAKLDAVIRMFEPGANPEAIAAICPRRTMAQMAIRTQAMAPPRILPSRRQSQS